MYPFSFIVILYWIINIIKNPPKKAFLNQFTFTVFISVFIEAGYFLNSNIIKIEYWQISSILTFITAIPLFSTSFVSKRFFAYIFILLINLMFLIVIPVNKPIVVGAGGVYEDVMTGNTSYIEPYFSKFTIFFFFLAFIQAISVLIAFKKFSVNDFHYFIHKLSKGIKIIILIVFVEVIIRYLFNGTFYNNCVNLVFGQSQSAYLTNVLRGSSYMLQGLTREGSHLVYALFTALIVLYVENKISFKNKQNVLFILLCVVEILISMSFTSILIFVMLSLMYSIYIYSANARNNRKLLRTIAIVILIILLIVPFSSSILYSIGNGYYVERLLSSFDDITNIFVSKQDISTYYYAATISSTSTRIFSIVDTLSLLRFRPFFGVGIGTTFCHGSTALTLAEIGCLGLLSYLSFYFFSIKINNNINRKKYIVIIFIWVMGNLFVSGARLMVRMDTFLFFVCLYLLLNNSEILKIKPIIEKKTC